MAKKFIKIGKVLRLQIGKLTRREMDALDDRLNRAPVQTAGPHGRSAERQEAEDK